MTQYIKYGALATRDFGSATQEGVHPPMYADCPLPWCRRTNILLTEGGKLRWHSDKFGFSCDATGLSPKDAESLQVDENGQIADDRDEFEKATRARAQAQQVRSNKSSWRSRHVKASNVG
jgi:hypothetical protein